MSSISLSLKLMLAATACAGLTLVACGDESSSGDSDNKSDEDNGRRDAGRDAGRDSGRRDAGLQTVTPGDECDPDAFQGRGGPCETDQCDAPPCISQCVDGVYGECESASDIIGAIRDSGILNRDGGFNLPDTGISVNADGGIDISVGDSSIPIPTNECPDTMMCDGTVGQIAGMPGLALCVPMGGFLPTPPTCTTQQDCKDLGLDTAPCSMLPILGQICLAACKP